MTFYDDPNREAVGLAPIFGNVGDNVAAVLSTSAVALQGTATMSEGIAGDGYTVRWGDGATGHITANASGGGTSTHGYAAAGTYDVELVNDELDAVVATDSLTVAGAAEE